VRERLKGSYSETGRPSIDPELLLRILLIGYLYGISSERKLVEELRMHLAWRGFTGLGFDQEIPHHCTFSKNRHGRFQESKVFEQLFTEVVTQCLAVGLTELRLRQNIYLAKIPNRNAKVSASVATGSDSPTQLVFLKDNSCE
jgi:transposase